MFIDYIHQNVISMMVGIFFPIFLTSVVLLVTDR